MRKLPVVVFAFVLGMQITTAQNVVSSGGGDVSNATIQLEQTIGEIALSDVSNSQVALEPGFQNILPKLGVYLSVRALLQGPYDADNALMNDDLRTLNLIPTITPYTIDNSEITDTSILNITGNNAIVDWVLIEVRDRIMDDIVIAFESGLLQRDGDIVDVDGVSPLRFNLYPGSYSVSVNHRNHLGIISSNAIEVSSIAFPNDFTDGSIALKGGASATANLNSGVVGMFAGDGNSNNTINLVGTDNDRDDIINTIVNANGNRRRSTAFVLSGYNNQDYNLNGFVNIFGTNNDYSDTLLNNVLNNPNNRRGRTNFNINQQF